MNPPFRIFNLIYDNHAESTASAIPCISKSKALEEARTWFELGLEEVQELDEMFELQVGDGTLFIEEEELRS